MWILIQTDSGRVISRHRTEEAAKAALQRRIRRSSRLLNRPGLFGGIDPDRWEGRLAIFVEALDPPQDG